MGERQVLAVSAELTNLDQVRRFIREAATALGARSAAVSDLQLAVDEAVTNIVVHGYRRAGGEIEVELERQQDALLVRVRDNAQGFDLVGVAAPDLSSSPLERTRPGGFGVHLIKQMVDHVRQRVLDDGRNELTLVKSRAVESA